MLNFNKMVSILYIFLSLAALLFGGYIMFTNMTRTNLLIGAFGMGTYLLILGSEQAKQDG
jgi:hypothetical protein